MKKCQAPGIYGTACKSIENCLYLKEAREGDPTVAPETASDYGCPPEAVQEISEIRDERISRGKER